jgi:copper transport protein
MRAEVLLAGLVLAATAALVRVTPPVDAPPGPLTRDVLAGPLRIRLDMAAPRRGPNALQMAVYDRRTGRPVSRVADLTLELRQPAKHIGPLRFDARRIAPGRYERTGVNLAVAGTWRAALTARVSDFDEFTGETDLKVAQ